MHAPSPPLPTFDACTSWALSIVLSVQRHGILYTPSRKSWDTMARYFERLQQKVKSLRGHTEAIDSASASHSSRPVSETGAAPLPSTGDNLKTENDASALPEEKPGIRNAVVAPVAESKTKNDPSSLRKEDPIDKDADVALVFLSRDRQDLWREAFLKLDDAERAALDFAPATDSDGGRGPEKKQEDMGLAIRKILESANAIKKKDEEKRYTTVRASRQHHCHYLLINGQHAHSMQPRKSTRSSTAQQRSSL